MSDHSDTLDEAEEVQLTKFFEKNNFTPHKGGHVNDEKKKTSGSGEQTKEPLRDLHVKLPESMLTSFHIACMGKDPDEAFKEAISAWLITQNPYASAAPSNKKEDRSSRTGIPSGDKGKQVFIRLRKDEYNRISSLAGIQETSPSGFIRDIINAAVAAENNGCAEFLPHSEELVEAPSSSAAYEKLNIRFATKAHTRIQALADKVGVSAPNLVYNVARKAIFS